MAPGSDPVSKLPPPSPREEHFADALKALIRLTDARIRSSEWNPVILKLLIDLALVFGLPVLLLGTGLFPLDVVGLFAAAAIGPTLLWLHSTCMEWWAVIRCDGWGRLRAIPQMLRLMTRTRTSWPHYHLKWPGLWALATLLMLACIIIVHVATSPRDIWSTALACICVVTTFVCLYLKYAIPPTVLLLTSSTPRQVEWAMEICGLLLPIRVLAMLDEERLTDEWQRSVARFKMILRTRDDAKWPETVRGFMRIAPIIVMDTSEPVRDAVKQETQTLLASDLLPKTIFVSNSQGQYPLLKACGLPATTIAVYMPRFHFDSLLMTLVHARTKLPSSAPFIFATRSLEEAELRDPQFLKQAGFPPG